MDDGNPFIEPVAPNGASFIICDINDGSVYRTAHKVHVKIVGRDVRVTISIFLDKTIKEGSALNRLLSFLASSRRKFATCPWHGDPLVMSPIRATWFELKLPMGRYRITTLCCHTS